MLKEIPSIKDKVDFVNIESQECEGSNVKASERMKLLAERATRLETQRSSLRLQLANATRAALQTLNAPITQHFEVERGQNGEISTLAQDLIAVHDAELGLMYLHNLQSLLRQLDKHLRVGDRARHNMDLHSLSQEMAHAVDLCRQARGLSSAIASFLPSSGDDSVETTKESNGVSSFSFVSHPSIRSHCSMLMKRTKLLSTTLKTLVSDAMQLLLQECNWPPPILDRENSGQMDTSQDDGDWNGFSSSNPAFVCLQQLAVTQISLQRILEHEAFEGHGGNENADDNDADGTVKVDLHPRLWLGEDLAKSIGTWLQHHFASGLPTDRPDKPEWLFSGALKAVKKCCKYVEALQPCIDAHNLQNVYSIQFEMARAIGTTAVGDVLKSHVLPRLADLQDPPSWLHYIDEAIHFEESLAPFRGVVTNCSYETREISSLDELWYSESVLNIAFENHTWIEQWISAEREDAFDQLASAIEGFSSTNATDTNRIESSPRASQLETVNSAVSEDLLSLLITLVRRGMNIPPGLARRNIFWEQVLAPSIKEFANHSSSEMIRAEQFHHLLDEIGLPRVGFILCTIHAIEHHLREPAGTLLSACASDECLSKLLAHQADFLAHIRRQWTYKLAKVGIDEFRKSMSKYKDQLQVLDPHAPSPALLSAASVLYSLIEKFSTHLDAILFRDIWRALASSVNQTIVHDVVMEVTFTHNTSQQLSVDVESLISVFKSCTTRPASYFKESREACFLLGLPHDEARSIAQHGTSSSKESRKFLLNAGIRALNGDQVASVLQSRADFDVN